MGREPTGLDVHQRLLAAAVIALCACGRIGYDGLGSGGGGVDAAGLGNGADASESLIDGAVGQCNGTVDECFQSSMTATTFAGSTGSANNDTAMYADLLTGSCGGAGGAELRVRYMVQGTGTIRLIAQADHDVFFYILRGDNCAAPEIECSAAVGPSVVTFDVAVTDGERLIAVADSPPGMCGSTTIRYEGLGSGD